LLTLLEGQVEAHSGEEFIKHLGAIGDGAHRAGSVRTGTSNGIRAGALRAPQGPAWLSQRL
jgi:hypothetical protein